MKVHAFSFTCSRDLEMSELMKYTLRKHCHQLARIEVTNTNEMPYGNGAGWDASMIKLSALRDICKYVDDYDWVLSVDSDVVFCNSQVFDWVNVVGSFRLNNYGILGIHQVGPLAKCHLGELHNMSGCSIYLRGGIAKRIANLTSEELVSVREQFKAYVLTENEDIVISYLAQLVGANPLPIPDFMYHGNFEEDIQNKTLKSFYHYNYLPSSFLGESTTGKWDIPRILRQKGIDL